jgi:hypothetical protein
MTRSLYTPSTSPVPQAPDRLLLFIQRAQHELVYARRRENRLPLHDSFRLTLAARSTLRPTLYVDRESGEKPAA